MISDQIRPTLLLEAGREADQTLGLKKGSKFPSVMLFTTATSQQIFAVLHKDNYALLLAQQGLYDGENWDTIFHPENKRWIGYLCPAIEKGNGVYEINSKVVEEILLLLQEYPDYIYNN